ncbi:MAG: hypothetical protein IJ002_07110, partial [Clostridia bacterium]|nr:hypothetical protein [Clostridia bacterium]
ILEQCGSDYLRKKTLVPPHHPPRFAAVKSVRAAARRISGGDGSNININLPHQSTFSTLHIRLQIRHLKNTIFFSEIP